MVKGKDVRYCPAARPAMMYGAETWAANKTQKKLDAGEMRMLWCGV